MKKYELFEAIDIVCLHCVEDTLEDNSCCETCPVRKTADVYENCESEDFV